MWPNLQFPVDGMTCGTVNDIQDIIHTNQLDA